MLAPVALPTPIANIDDLLDHVVAINEVRLQLKWIQDALDRAWDRAEFAADPRVAYSAACADAVVSAQQVQDALGAVIAAMAMQANDTATRA